MAYNISAWIQSTRPKTLFASLTPVLLGISIALYEKAPINVTIIIITLLCALLLQISTNLSNDYFDHKNKIDGKNRQGPSRGIHSGAISINSLKRGLIISFGLSLFFGIYLMLQGGWPIILIGILSMLMAYAYTGGPYPLSYHALGEVAAFIFFGPIAVWGSTYLLTHQSSSLALIAGTGVGFISAAIMAINNLRDRESDQKTHKKTLAIYLGQKWSKVLPVFFILLSSFIPIVINHYWYHSAVIWALLTPYLFFINWRKILLGPSDNSLNQALANTGKYLLVYGMAMAIGLHL